MKDTVQFITSVLAKALPQRAEISDGMDGFDDGWQHALTGIALVCGVDEDWLLSEFDELARLSGTRPLPIQAVRRKREEIRWVIALASSGDTGQSH